MVHLEVTKLAVISMGLDSSLTLLAVLQVYSGKEHKTDSFKSIYYRASTMKT